MFLTCGMQLSAQVAINMVRVDDAKFSVSSKFPSKAKSELNARIKTETWLKKMRNQGYLEASIDSTFFLNQTLTCYVYVGELYRFSKLEMRINQTIVDSILLPKKLRTGIASYEEVVHFMHQFQQEKLNQGYPFSKVSLENVTVNDGEMTGVINLSASSLVKIDSVILHGNSGAKPLWIQNYLDIHEGDPYSQEKIKAIDKKLQQLPFLVATQQPIIKLKNESASIHLYLDKRKSNNFNFFLGLLPNTASENKKLTVTADGSLKLLGSFGLGEEIDIRFQQLKPQTQLLELSASLPFIHTVPIGVSGGFNLYKNDSAYFDVDADLALVYPFAGVNEFSAYYHNKSSNILNYDTNSITPSNTLPDEIDFGRNEYGLRMHLQNLNYPINPSNGYQANFSAGIATRNVKRSNAIEELYINDAERVDELYSNVEESKLQYRLNANVSLYKSVSQGNVLVVQNDLDVLIAKYILRNEMFRIGGQQTLRGFNEDAFVTPFSNITTFEYRFLLSKNSYFHTFVDVGIILPQENGFKEVAVPFGFGTGVALETKGGIFSLSYALGKYSKDPLLLRDSKIHFGYINLF